LRRQNLGEADRLLVAFSPHHGKIRIIAKGVRRPRSRKAGHLEPFTRVQLILARGRELDIITQAEAIASYEGLRNDLVRVGEAAYVIELLDRFTLDRDENHALYRLLVKTLERLDGGVSADIVLRYYELRLLDLMGYRPELFQCLSCHSEVRPEDQYFSPESGGVLCPVCGEGAKARPISLRALKVLRHYQRSTYGMVVATEVGAQTRAEVEALMEAYLSHILERKLNSPAFIRRVRNMAEGEG
jgi:DNA repair protein RecO (recombination protein O)